VRVNRGKQLAAVGLEFGHAHGPRAPTDWWSFHACRISQAI
jgi:hypothetical protein